MTAIKPAPSEVVERVTKPIIGIEYRTALEAFDIMADRIRSEIATLLATIEAQREALQAVKDAARLPPNVMRSKRCTIPSNVYHQVCAALDPAQAKEPKP